MLLYDSPNPAPNPRRVRIFAAEKGIDLSSKEVSIPKREQKAKDFVAKNPRGQTPILELDDGKVIAESVAIMRYLEGLSYEEMGEELNLSYNQVKSRLARARIRLKAKLSDLPLEWKHLLDALSG